MRVKKPLLQPVAPKRVRAARLFVAHQLTEWRKKPTDLFLKFNKKPEHDRLHQPVVEARVARKLDKKNPTVPNARLLRKAEPPPLQQPHVVPFLSQPVSRILWTFASAATLRRKDALVLLRRHPLYGKSAGLFTFRAF